MVRNYIDAAQVQRLEEHRLVQPLQASPKERCVKRFPLIDQQVTADQLIADTAIT